MPAKRGIILFVINICFSTVLYAQSKRDSSYIKANEIAHEVVNAMGGLKNFANTNYIGWNFFGHRQIIWDKVHNRVRIDFLKEDIIVIAYLHKDEGKLFINGEQNTQPDSLKKYINKAQSVWMNDSYWLIMPFKLFDPGVQLKYLGIAQTMDSIEANILELTFDHVGATPENKYHIYVD
ncbi:MAG: hypothetical protein H7Y00_06930, partial [Fimbriimonadaceae bacterium]|nr:hypothetical protein [Chitinophagales bacterium]